MERKRHKLFGRTYPRNCEQISKEFAKWLSAGMVLK